MSAQPPAPPPPGITAPLASPVHYGAVGPGPMPRWFWWLPVLVLLLWWPIDPYWASDDWFALHYAQDFGNVLRDWTGPQYGAADLFFFWRPLITFTHWLDVVLGGGHPFWAHLFNVLVHAANALLCACLWRRLASEPRAFAAGLLFALGAGHIGGLGWAAGRTDGLAALAGLASVLLLLQWLEGKRRACALALLVFALGLLCKETVLCVPGLVALVAFAHASQDLTSRWRATVRATWPFAAVLLGYLVVRLLLLGRLGGYASAAHDPLAMLRGLGTYALHLIAPMTWTTAPDLLPATLTTLPSWPWLAALPTLLPLPWLLLARAHRRGLWLGVSWFLLASVPLASFLADASYHHNLRYFGLAFAGLAGLLAAGGRAATLLALLAFVPALVQVRLDQWRADVDSGRMHRQLLQHVRDSGDEGPWFVAGLPHLDRTHIALQFHFGVDRVLEPPFGNGGGRVYAHRPIMTVPGCNELLDENDMPTALPEGTTVLLRGGDLLTTLPERSLPELPLPAELTVDCTSPTLERIAKREVATRIATPGVRTAALRVTFFTATGYLAAIVENHAPADARDGHLDLLPFFTDATWATNARLIDGLQLPVVHDLDTVFPVLLEGGRLANGRFAPTHRARRLVPFRFDRALPALLRRLNG